MYIKTGDTVAVIAGRDQYVTDKKGNKTRRTGKVIKVLRDSDRVIVEGVNIVSKHQRPTQGNDKGGIVKKEASIHVSNVALVDPKTKEPTRVGYKVETSKDGKTTKVRVALKSGTVLDKK